MLLALDHIQIGIPTGSEHIARDFYCGKLGFSEIEKYADVKHTGGVWLKLGVTQIHLGIEDEDHRSKSRSHLGIQVDDVSAMRALIEQLGLPIRESTPITGIERFATRDPFGNGIEFLQKGRAHL